MVPVYPEKPMSHDRHSNPNHSTRLHQWPAEDAVIGISLGTHQSNITNYRTKTVGNSSVEVDGAELLRSLDKILSQKDSDSSTSKGGEAQISKMPSFSIQDQLQPPSDSRRYIFSQDGNSNGVVIAECHPQSNRNNSFNQ